MRADSRRSEALSQAGAAPINVVIVTLDGHLGSTIKHAERRLQRELPGLSLTMHPASDWGDDPVALGTVEKGQHRFADPGAI